MLIARAFSGFPTWIKLYINSCKFLKNGPLVFARSSNMLRRSVCMSASFLENIVNNFYREIVNWLQLLTGYKQ